jgi:hypothetical protein
MNIAGGFSLVNQELPRKYLVKKVKVSAGATPPMNEKIQRASQELSRRHRARHSFHRCANEELIFFDN